MVLSGGFVVVMRQDPRERSHSNGELCRSRFTQTRNASAARIGPFSPTTQSSTVVLPPGFHHSTAARPRVSIGQTSAYLLARPIIHTAACFTPPLGGVEGANRRKLWREFFRPLHACLFQGRCHRPGETRRIANPVRRSKLPN